MPFDFEDIVKGLKNGFRGAKQKLQTTKEKAEWVWEALQGDFNPNRSVGQVGADMVVCLIPGVDTVMDVRDLIANIIAIVRAPTSGMAWFSLVLTLVGFIPELGSVAKGVVKMVFVKLRPLIKHADDLTNASKMVKYVDEALDQALPDIINYLRTPQVQKFLTASRIPDILKKVSTAIIKVTDRIQPAELAKQFNQKIESVKEIIGAIEPFLPASAAPRLKQLYDGMTYIPKELNKRVAAYMEALRAMMRRIAERLDEMYWVAWTQQVNKGWVAPLSEQGARRLIARHQPDWIKTGKVEFEQLNAKSFKARKSYKEGVRNGAPELSDEEIRSFASVAGRPVRARPLRNGETLYRVVDPTSGTFSTSWMSEDVWKQINAADNPRAAWRGGLGVKAEWNQNGQYITYTYNHAKDGDVMVWEGPASAQFLKDAEHPEAGFYEGGLEQIRFRPLEQIKDAKPDGFVGAQFPDMVEGGAMKSGIRIQANDDRIVGPQLTGWGYKDFDDQHDLIGLPNPNRE
ncbi:MAG: hypothetical protein QM581_03410 [Pseudomonas sp.]